MRSIEPSFMFIHVIFRFLKKYFRKHTFSHYYILTHTFLKLESFNRHSFVTHTFHSKIERNIFLLFYTCTSNLETNRIGICKFK